jgi:hypothetical protein
MYVVVSYNNSKVNQNIEFKNTFADYRKSVECAKKYAEEIYGIENVVNIVIDKYVNIKNIVVEFTERDSCGKQVIGVVRLPELVKDEQDENVYERRDSVSTRKSSLTSRLFGDVQSYEHKNENSEEKFLVVISDSEDTDDETDKDSKSEFGNDDKERNSVSDTEKDDKENEEYDYDYDYYDDEMDIDDLYDDRYDEREDYDRGYGYEDECYECIDF